MNTHVKALKKSLFATIVLLAGLSQPVMAEQATDSSTPSSDPVLEQQTDQTPSENVQEKPDEKPTPKIGGRNISAFTRNLFGNTTIGGYFDNDYSFPDNQPAFFDQHHLVLQVSSILHDRLFFNTEVEFEH